jgi:hypothetical protein
MVKDGVIDPAKVTRGALENAASIAAMILTTEALITDIPEKDKTHADASRRRNGLLKWLRSLIYEFQSSFRPPKRAAPVRGKGVPWAVPLKGRFKAQLGYSTSFK